MKQTRNCRIILVRYSRVNGEQSTLRKLLSYVRNNRNHWQIGGIIGRRLLAAGQPVRAVLRDAEKGRPWADRGCEVALATIEDAASLSAAFRGADAVLALVPSNFDPQPGFSEARSIAAALHSALKTARPTRVVYLSKITPSNR